MFIARESDFYGEDLGSQKLLHVYQTTAHKYLMPTLVVGHSIIFK